MERNEINCKQHEKIIFLSPGLLGLGSGGGPGPKSRYKPQEEEFLDARREERERIGQLGVSSVWGKSPLRPE